MKPAKLMSKAKSAKNPVLKPSRLHLKVAAPKPTKKNSPASRKGDSPVREDGVSIRLLAPAARKVCVAGTFNGWSAGANLLSPAEGGEWRVVLPLARGRYEYLLVVDGIWLPDPAACEFVTNEFGGLNSVISVN